MILGSEVESLIHRWQHHIYYLEIQVKLGVEAALIKKMSLLHLHANKAF